MHEPSRCLRCGKRLVAYRMINGRTQLECVRCNAPEKTESSAASLLVPLIIPDPAETMLPALAPLPSP